MSKNSGTYKRLFSLLGLFPLSVYLFIHLFKNLTSLQGPDAFNATYEAARATPLIVPIMILVIWIPVLFHGIYGLAVMKQAKLNLVQFRYFENIKFVVQRLSGIGLLLFIPAHLFNSRILPTIQGEVVDFNHMAEAFSNPVTLTVYLLGILGAAYHVANGIWQFSIGWGLVTSQRGMNRMQIVSYLVFLVLLTMGYASIWGFIRS